MKSSLLFPVFLVFMLIFAPVSLVSAQLPHFSPNFDRVIYDSGSPGSIALDIENSGQSFEIGTIGIRLYFVKTDGSTFKTEFFGKDYGANPFLLLPNAQELIFVDFVMPQRTDLVFGGFYFIFEMNIREQNTTTYHLETSGPHQAEYDGNPCILLPPQSTPEPSPSNGPTPTPVPTTPTPKPTSSPTATPSSTPEEMLGIFLSFEALVAIVVAFAVLIVLMVIIIVRKRK